MLGLILPQAIFLHSNLIVWEVLPTCIPMRVYQDGSAFLVFQAIIKVFVKKFSHRSRWFPQLLVVNLRIKLLKPEMPRFGEARSETVKCVKTVRVWVSHCSCTWSNITEIQDPPEHGIHMYVCIYIIQITKYKISIHSTQFQQATTLLVHACSQQSKL